MHFARTTSKNRANSTASLLIKCSEIYRNASLKEAIFETTINIIDFGENP